MFLSLLKRHLGSPEKRANRTFYPNYSQKIDLLAYCLMPNHFRLFVYQKEADGMTLLLKSISTAYSMFFNKKYQRVGPVFQQRYKAVLIDSDSQLMHLSQYIHLNPKNYQQWKWSSLDYCLKNKQADWVHPSRILALHDDSTSRYQAFLDEYKDRRDELEAMKNQFAG